MNSLRKTTTPLTGAAEDQIEKQRFLVHQRLDDLSQGFVSMAAEMWIVKDRIAVLEQVLAKHGIPAPAAVETFEPSDAFKAQLDSERRAWIQRMIGALFPRGLPKAE